LSSCVHVEPPAKLLHTLKALLHAELLGQQPPCMMLQCYPANSRSARLPTHVCCCPALLSLSAAAAQAEAVAEGKGQAFAEAAAQAEALHGCLPAAPSPAATPSPAPNTTTAPPPLPSTPVVPPASPAQSPVVIASEPIRAPANGTVRESGHPQEAAEVQTR
jgi:hypothetical protein